MRPGRKRRPSRLRAAATKPSASNFFAITTGSGLVNSRKAKPSRPSGLPGISVMSCVQIRRKRRDEATNAAFFEPRNIDAAIGRSEEHTSELQSLMRTSYAAFCLKQKHTPQYHPPTL